MERHLNLIKTDFEQTEKRIFPRFPFSYLTFKSSNDGANKHVFEIKDISYTGMQLCLKDGGHDFTPGNTIGGTVHWQKAALDNRKSQ